MFGRGGKAWPNGDGGAHFDAAQLCSSTTPQSTSAWLGVGGICKEKEKWLRFVVLIVWIFAGGGILRHT
jgi:hypothetical protein